MRIMKFYFDRLNSDNAVDWQKLRLEDVRDFPLGFLITEKEALEMRENRAKDILNSGSTRGVFEQKKLIGFCGYRPEQLERTRHRAEIGPFFLTSKFQGSGAAKALMVGVINEARAARIEQLELFVDTENYRAIRFYEKHGFKKIATHPDGVRIDGKTRNDYFYCLRLVG